MSEEEFKRKLEDIYDETYLHDLTDEDVEDYGRIGSYMMQESLREINRRKEKLKEE